MASLDACKAFDRVNHYSLFIALINNNVPLPFIKVIIFWHFNLRGMVRWCGHFSDMFCIKSGIRQGGINSPLFFNIFINELIVKLRNSGHGCYIADMLCGCIFFADDILLLSASLCRLQLMLNICVEFAVQNDVKFNHLKSHLFQCGMSDDLCLLLPKLSIGVHELEWVKELKYLGVVFVAGKKLSVNIDLNCRKFLGTSFAILQKCKYLSEEVLCKLILTNCLPTLLYGVDSVSLMKGQIKRMSVAFNTVFRRIFNMSKFSSMRIIYNFIGTKTLDCIYDERCFCLFRNCFTSSFELLRFCSLFASSQRDLNFKYDVHLGLSVGAIKQQVALFFRESLGLS